jgi:hypothetical protein
MRQRSAFLGIIFSVFVVPCFLQAQTAGLTTFWGPKEFVRTTAQPVTEKVTLSIKGYGPPFIIHIRNGNTDGTNRISSAAVYIDGFPIFHPNDFSQQVTELQKELGLLEGSILGVWNASIPGSKRFRSRAGLGSMPFPEKPRDGSQCRSRRGLGVFPMDAASFPII